MRARQLPLSNNTSAINASSHPSCGALAVADSTRHARAYDSAAHASADNCTCTKLLQMERQLRWKLRIRILQHQHGKLQFVRRHVVCPISAWI